MELEFVVYVIRCHSKNELFLTELFELHVFNWIGSKIH